MYTLYQKRILEVNVEIKHRWLTPGQRRSVSHVHARLHKNPAGKGSREKQTNQLGFDFHRFVSVLNWSNSNNIFILYNREPSVFPVCSNRIQSGSESNSTPTRHIQARRGYGDLGLLIGNKTNQCPCDNLGTRTFPVERLLSLFAGDFMTRALEQPFLSLLPGSN